MSKNSERDALMAMLKGACPDPDELNMVMTPRAFVEFLDGSLPAALMLNQLLFWYSDNRNAGRLYVYKTDKEWMGELCVGQYSVRQARELLENKGLLKTKVRRANGKPTVHYYMQGTALMQQWEEFVDAKKKQQNQ